MDVTCRHLRIYVAGPLTPRGVWNKNPAIDYLANVRNMVSVGVRLLKYAYFPFVPALDMMLFLGLQDGESLN